jgi:hypothetical protein
VAAAGEVPNGAAVGTAAGAPQAVNRTEEMKRRANIFLKSITPGGSLRLGLFLMNPLRMVLDEFLDVNTRHPERGAYRQCAVTLDDECNRLSSGMDEMVNGDRHEQKYTK